MTSVLYTGMMNLIYIEILQTEHHYILPTLGMSMSTSQMTSVLYKGDEESNLYRDVKYRAPLHPTHLGYVDVDVTNDVSFIQGG